MIRSSLILATATVLTLTACSDSKVESGPSVSIDLDGDTTATATAITVDGDSDSGNFALNLPGGIAANLKLPAGAIKGESFDIDGVGLYPGAVVRSVKVNASGGAERRAVVEIGFTAPGDAAAVADWYQTQFGAKAMAVTRRGETLAGRNADGADFTVALTGTGPGRARGLVTIVDAKG